MDIGCMRARTMSGLRRSSGALKKCRAGAGAPQRLKPAFISEVCGTSELVPSRNPFQAEFFCKLFEDARYQPVYLVSKWLIRTKQKADAGASAQF
jgi:hypothetical protein